MAWSKAYSNWITWVNRPSTQSPINETALNKISVGLDTVDDRVIELDSKKANQSDFLTVVQSIALNQSTGELIITAVNGTVTRIDTLLEKIAVNFDFDDDPTSQHYQNLIIELDDGTNKYIDLSALITQYEFTDTSTISFDVAQDGKISAIVKAGSINGTHLDPNYLAQIQTQVAAAASSASDAADSASDAHLDAQLAQSYAIGTNGQVREGDATDNAKYYKEQAASTVQTAINNLPAVARTGSYNDLSDKPEHLGHSIEDSTTTFTDRANLKFTGNVEVSDDSTNDETIVNVKGKPDHVYSTKAQMLADVSNIGEGEMAYTTEDAGDVLTRIEDLEEDVSEITSNLTYNNFTNDIVTASATRFTIFRKYGYKIGNRVHVELFGTTNSSISSSDWLVEIPVDGTGAGNKFGTITVNGSTYPCSAIIESNGTKMYISPYFKNINANEYVGFIFDFVLQ